MMTEFHAWVIFYVVIKISTGWPYKWKDQYHWTTCISIKVWHFVKILSWCQFIKHDIKNINATLHKIIIHSTNNFLTLFSQKAEILSEQMFHLFNNIYDISWYDVLSLSFFLKIDSPCINDRLPSQMNRFQIDHTTTWDGGGWGNSEIVDFEHHCECRWKLDSLSIRKTQHFIIIQHCVHIFNPQCIDWTIKNNPFLSITAISNISPYQSSYNTISPLICQQIYIPKQFIHCNWFRVETLLLYTFMIIIQWALLIELFHSFSQRATYCSFSCPCKTNNHDTVTNHYCLH